MAGSLAPSDMILYDGFPGLPNVNSPQPSGGFDTTQGGWKATTPMYPPGTKIQKYQDSSVGAQGTSVANKGFYTMMYTAMYDYTNAVDASEGKMCTIACGSTKSRGGIFVTQDTSGGNFPTAATNRGPIAIPCVSLGFSFASPEYGWFWVAGVCPNSDLSGLDVTGFLIDATAVLAGDKFTTDYDATTVKLSPADLTLGYTCGLAIGDASV